MDNLNKAYKQVWRNKGAGGVDKMDYESLLPYLREYKDELTESIRIGNNALLSVCRHVSVGYRYAVGIDLEGFFDAVHHSRLLEIFSRTIKDGCVISLIHKYLRSGVMVDCSA